MTRRVSPAARRMDAVAVAVLVTGLALYAYSFWGLRQVVAGRIVAAPGHRLVERVDRFRRVGTLGLTVAAGGLVVGVVALVGHTRRPATPAS